MVKRKGKGPPEDWAVAHEVEANGRTITVGTELSIKGQRGRFRFVEHVWRPIRDTEWITVWGGPKGSEQMRSFRIDQIKTVHRIVTTGRSLLDNRKKAKKEESDG